MAMKRKGITAGLLALTLVLIGAAGCGGAKGGGESKETKPAVSTSQTGQQPAQQAGQSGQPAQQAGQSGQSAPATAKGGAQYQVATADSTASYSVHEKFLEQNLAAVAVGKTSAITGAIVLDGGKLQPSTVTVDLRTLKSDKSRRDDQIKTRGIETNKYPTAEFAITGAEGAAPTFADGQEVAFKLAGKMKLHGVEKPLVWDAKGLLQGDTFRLTATVAFKMGEFNIEPPSILNLISVDENVQLDVAIVAKKG